MTWPCVDPIVVSLKEISNNWNSHKEYMFTVLFCPDLQYLGATKYFISTEEYSYTTKISERSLFQNPYMLFP